MSRRKRKNFRADNRSNVHTVTGEPVMTRDNFPTPEESNMHQPNLPVETLAAPAATVNRIKPVAGKPILAPSEVDTGYTEKAMLLGIDLGTSRSSIVSMNGTRKTIETYV